MSRLTGFAVPMFSGDWVLFSFILSLPLIFVWYLLRPIILEWCYENIQKGISNKPSSWFWALFLLVWAFVAVAITWVLAWVGVGSHGFWQSLGYLVKFTWPAWLIMYLEFWSAARTDDPSKLFLPAWRQKNKPVIRTNIHKFKDITNLSRIFEALHLSHNDGKPLVCYWDGNEYADTENEYSELEREWLEDRKLGSVTCEDRGLVVGAPGSGKTSYLISQLINWMASGKSFVATDIKPEIWATLRENGVFERYGYTDWVVNPTDPAANNYNIFSEATSTAELNEILAVIIPEGEASAQVFVENARRLLKAVILELGERASLPECQRYINRCDDVPELLKMLRQSENEVVVAIAKDITRTAKNDNLLSSIMTSLSKAFAFLDDERIRVTTANSEFKLKEVLLKPRQAVFLQFEQEYRNTTATLFGAMVAYTLRLLQTNYRRRDDVFVALDEIINCAPIPRFLDSLNTIRSAKMPTFLYLQALEGLDRVYGPGASRLFLGACDFKAIFKISDIATAQTFSTMLGDTETTIKSFSNSESSGNSVSNVNEMGYGVGGSSSSSSSSTSVQTTILPVFEAAEFQKLAAHSAVVLYQGEAGLFTNMPCHYIWYPVTKRPEFVTPGELLEEQREAV